jgi:hypothetical protein
MFHSIWDGEYASLEILLLQRFFTLKEIFQGEE